MSIGDKCCSEERSTRTRGQTVGRRFGADSDDRQGEVAFEEYLGVAQVSPCHPPPHCWRTRGPPLPPAVGGLGTPSCWRPRGHLPSSTVGGLRDPLTPPAVRGLGDPLPPTVGELGDPSPRCWRTRGCGQGEQCKPPSGRVAGGAEGSGHCTLTPSFSFRAFYLERSNLPTDASTTAVKIDQVCPTFPHHSCHRAGTELGAVGVQMQPMEPRVPPQPESWQRIP